MLLVSECERVETTVKYILTKFCNLGHQYKVLYEKSIDKVDCEYRLWNTNGIPCSHIFCVMKHEFIVEFPKRLIMRRWCKDVKSYEEWEQEEEDSDRTFLLRYGALSATSLWMSFPSAK